VETCFPILDPAHKKTVIEHGLMTYLKDNTQAWLLDADGMYHRLQPHLGDAPFNAQEYLLSVLADPAVAN
jgi:polyphosphate kinase